MNINGKFLFTNIKDLIKDFNSIKNLEVTTSYELDNTFVKLIINESEYIADILIYGNILLKLNELSNLNLFIINIEWL